MTDYPSINPEDVREGAATVPLVCHTCGQGTAASVTESALLLEFWRFYCSATCRDSDRVDAWRNRAGGVPALGVGR